MVAPKLHDALGRERVLAACQEIQYAEISEQSAAFQEMFNTFNVTIFPGAFPTTKSWWTMMCGIGSNVAGIRRARLLLPKRQASWIFMHARSSLGNASEFSFQFEGDPRQIDVVPTHLAASVKSISCS